MTLTPLAKNYIHNIEERAEEKFVKAALNKKMAPKEIIKIINDLRSESPIEKLGAVKSSSVSSSVVIVDTRTHQAFEYLAKNPGQTAKVAKMVGELMLIAQTPDQKKLPAAYKPEPEVLLAVSKNLARELNEVEGLDQTTKDLINPFLEIK